jgi:signal transduction histidine kinase/AmiR/NasT family two-component response regulator/HPt (histidine-containing phosphotransfer) domain-containing protein
MSALFAGCVSSGGKQTLESLYNASFKGIPGITDDEIKAVEAFQAQNISFIFAMAPSTEGFYGEDGDVAGFAALFSSWLSELFDIPFKPALYSSQDLAVGLKSGEIDFAGLAPSADDQQNKYYMTDDIAERPVKMIRLDGSKPLSEISETRPVRLAFVSGAMEAGLVQKSFEYEFEALFINSIELAYDMLNSGKADAFFCGSSAEIVFETYEDVVSEVYLPLILNPLCLTALNPDYAPLISVVQRALQNGGYSYLSELYKSGYREYQKHRLYVEFNEEERQYLRSHSVVPFVAQYYNYPISFYNSIDKQWQGIVFDLLTEVSDLTGLSFELINDQQTEFADLLKKLESGEASMISRLVRSKEREDLFLFSETSVMSDKYVLISRSDHRNISISEIPYEKVGIVKDTAQGDLFCYWFPNNENIAVYDGLDNAFGALDRGEVDMVMSSQSQLLFMTNYHEFSGYKANIAFNTSLEANLGFNKDASALCSIIDKALRMTDTAEVTEQWLRKTYDYQAKLAEARLPWLIGVVSLLLCVLILLFILFQRYRYEGRRLKDMVHKRTAELESANKAKSGFLANMSHELRTPLNVIVGLTDLRMEDEDLPGGISEDIKKINSAGAILLGIVNDVLDISKIEAGKLTLIPAEYCMASLLNDIITLNMIRIENKPIEFRIDIISELPYKLFGDELRIKQVFNNLLSNAFKYTKEGNVTLCVRSKRESEKDVRMEITVSDTGIGIRPEDIQKLFSDYNQVDTQANRKIEGTGLGLSITKKMVELMGGEISVESEYGKGTAFHVHIRQGFVDEGTLGAEVTENLRHFCYSDNKQHASTKLSRIDLSYARVLVVDDFKTNLDVAAGMMRKYKMKVDCVSSGQAAISLVERKEPVYSAIFMDHMMPGMDGVETTRIIREEIGTEYAKTMPIIVLTANAIAGNEEMFLAKGFQAFLSKPIDIMRLDKVIRQWVRDPNRDESLAGLQSPLSGGPAGDSEDVGNGAKPFRMVNPLPGLCEDSEDEIDNGERGLAGWRIEGLDITAALQSFGDEKIVWHVLRTFAEDTPALLEQLRSVTPETLQDYRIIVHGIKGSCYGIYAKPLGEQANKLEDAARAGQYSFVETHNHAFIQGVEMLLDKLRQLLESATRKEIRTAPDTKLLDSLLKASQHFDIDGVDKAMSELTSYDYETDEELIHWLNESVKQMAFKEITQRLSQILS